MNLILAIPFEIRLVLIFAIGTCVASWLNLAIYQLAWTPRLISPWSKAPDLAIPRRHTDRIPILGWFGLRRESSLHGKAFWVRPVLLEIGVGLCLAALYWWEIGKQALVIAPEIAPPPTAAFLLGDLPTILHLQFASHVILFLLMVVASFIDIDEMIIPDTITIPGTLTGLFFAAIFPWSLLSGYSWQAPGTMAPVYEFLQAASPSDWPDTFAPAPNYASLILALGCWWAWCFALMPRRWMTRRGLGVAGRILFRRLYRERLTAWLFGLGCAGSVVLCAGWYALSAAGWAGLLTALIGIAAGGGVVWGVRIIGSWAMGREAMGFGDVTLMAMIGTFTGWQPAVIAFLIAPLAALTIAIAKWALHRDREIPFGPYLCLGSAVVIVFWPAVWLNIASYFDPWWLIPATAVVCLPVMWILLLVMRALRGADG